MKEKRLTETEKILRIKGAKESIEQGLKEAKAGKGILLRELINEHVS